MLATKELPRYKGPIITVWATQIAGIVPNEEGAMLIPQDEGYMPIQVNKSYVDEHDPELGGYFLIMPNGNKEYLSKTAFEFTHTLLVTDDFIEEAVDPVAVRCQEQNTIDNMHPAERLIRLVRSCPSYYYAKAILQDIAGEPTLKWVGNEHHGWNKLVYKYHDAVIVLSPRSGPDGLGDWYVQ